MDVGARVDALIRAQCRTARVADDVRRQPRSDALDDEGAEVAAEVGGVVVLREGQVPPDVREGVQSERREEVGGSAVVGVLLDRERARDDLQVVEPVQRLRVEKIGKSSSLSRSGDHALKFIALRAG